MCKKMIYIFRNLYYIANIIMELPNELNERILMAIIGVFKEYPQLITEEIIEEINNYEEFFYMYLLNGFRYFHDEDELVDFGEYSLINKYLTKNDEKYIREYVNYYDDLTGYIEYDVLEILSHKINYFIGIYSKQCRYIIIDIIIRITIMIMKSTLE